MSTKKYKVSSDGIFVLDDDGKPIASFKQIEGLPLVVLPEDETTQDIALKAFGKVLNIDNSPYDRGLYYGFVKGYNKSTGKRIYTEEDLRKAFNAGVHHESSWNTGSNYKTLQEDYEEMLQSLQKKHPVAVELNMEVDADDERNWYVDCPSGKYWMDEPAKPSRDRLYSNAKYLKPVLNIDNTITPVNVFYE